MNQRGKQPTESIDSKLSPTKAARQLLDSGCQSAGKLRSALSSMVDHCSYLKRKLGAATSKIAHLSRLLAPGAVASCKDDDAPHCCSGSCAQANCSFHSHSSVEHKIIRELIGQGYNPADSGRTLRRHRLAVMNALKTECGEDQLKQYEVACAIVGLFKQTSNKKQKKLDSSRDAVIKGLESTFAIVAARSNGNSRYTSKDRCVRDALTTAIMMAKPDNVSISSMRAVLGEVVDWRALKAGLDRAAAFKAGDGDAIRQEPSAGAYDPEWKAFVKECWMASTRETRSIPGRRRSGTECVGWSRSSKKCWTG